MKKHNYPHYELHKNEHKKFTRTVQNLKADYLKTGGSKQLMSKIVEEVWQWYRIHIYKNDKKFGEFFKNLKISQNKILMATWIKEIRTMVQSLPGIESKKERENIINEIRGMLENIEKLDIGFFS